MKREGARAVVRTGRNDVRTALTTSMSSLGSLLGSAGVPEPNLELLLQLHGGRV